MTCGFPPASPRHLAVQVEAEGHDLGAWVDPEQQALAAERAGLSAVLAELKPFEMNAATLSQVR